MKQIFLLLSIIFFFNACSIKQPKKQIKAENKLYNLLINSSKDIDKKEAYNLSLSVIEYSKNLAEYYNISTTPLFHNMLIHLNIKQKGFCYHYANDLIKFLNEKNYKSFNFKKVVANKNEYFEHTAVAIKVKNIDINNSIVLDAWRNSGELYFSKIKNDKKYKWSFR